MIRIQITNYYFYSITEIDFPGSLPNKETFTDPNPE